MLQPLERRVLRRHACFDSPDDARGFVAAVARRSTPGMAVVILLDGRRRLLDLVAVDDGAEHLPDVLVHAQHVGHRRTEHLVLLTDRSGEPLADRPDDELTWEELCGQADAAGLVLLDWWVLSGRQAFSVAEFAPTPAGW